MPTGTYAGTIKGGLQEIIPWRRGRSTYTVTNTSSYAFRINDFGGGGPWITVAPGATYEPTVSECPEGAVLIAAIDQPPGQSYTASETW